MSEVHPWLVNKPVHILGTAYTSETIQDNYLSAYEAKLALCVYGRIAYALEKSEE